MQLVQPRDPEALLVCMESIRAHGAMQKSYQSAGASRGKEDPGAIISGVRQRRIIPPRLCGWERAGEARGVIISPPVSRLIATRPSRGPLQSDRPCAFVCLFVWVCARAFGPSNSIGPRQEIRAAVLASFQGQSERDAERGCSDWGRTEKVSHG